MALSLNQAYDIAQNLSNEQLMQAYTNGTLPQFVLFSEMELRQKEMKNKAKMPTQTVAEKLVGSPPEKSGIGAMMPQQPPQMAARGGITRASTLDMGYSENLPEEAKKAIAMRLRAMKDLEEPMEFASGGPVSYAEGSDGYPVPDKDRPPTSAEIADMIINPMIQAESSGRQFDSKGNTLRSRAGAFGIMQVKPATGKEAATKAGFAWEPDKFYKDPEYNTKVGRAYLIQMLDKYGDTEKALAAYNWGPTNLSKALASAQESGRDWKSYLPGETSAYLGKILGSRQALLPPRQDAQGADTQEPEYQKPYVDPTLAGGKGSDPSIYNNVNQYPYQRSGLDSLGQILNAAKTVQKTRFSTGGIALAGGNDGKSLADIERYNRIKQFAAIQRAISGKDEPIYGVNPPEPTDYPIDADESERLSREYETSIPGLSRVKPNSATVGLDRAIEQSRNPKTQVGYVDTETNHGYNPPQPEPQYPADVDNQAIGTGMERFVSPSQMEGRGPIGIRGLFPPSPFPSWQREGVKLPESRKTPSPEAEGIASGLPVGMGPEQKPQAKGIPATGVPGRGAAPGGAGAPGAGGGRGAAGGDAGDSSFASVFGQIQKAVGSDISGELADSKKKYQETLASMKNDKVVDALFAAAKTLAGQRVGSVNYADAVANAGIAAQEAQKRIYKSEDDMRKYRADLVKAQQDGDYKAATIAMSRINNEETNRRGLQTAMMQTSRLIQSQESSEKRANIAAASKEIVTLESKRADLDRMLLDPSKIGIADQKAIEAERRRLDSEIAAARAGLLYWQTGANPDDIKAELIRRGLIK